MVVLTDPASYQKLKAKVGQITVSADISQNLEPGDLILVDDGKLQLEVTSVKPQTIKTRAINHHRLKPNKRINLPGKPFLMPFLTEKDVEDIKFGCAQKVDFIAASFVNSPDDIQQIREILKQQQATQIKIIAKIESQYAINNFDKILAAADGIMVARGDLGLEIPYFEVPVVQKMMIRKCREAGKPVVVATQMLDSMEKNPHPTRAEVTDVYIATELGADATMLSGESAAGQYPIEAVKVMSTINARAEKEFYNKLYYQVQLEAIEKISRGARAKIARSVARKTINGDFKFTVVLSRTGQLLQEVAKFRPNTNILGVTNNAQQTTMFGITSSVFMSPDTSQFEAIKANKQKALDVAKIYGAKKGDKLLVVENKAITILSYR